MADHSVANSATSPSFQTSQVRYGGDYNPEQWSPEVWREDVALMREAGVNLVSVGIFSWSTLHPGPDEWNFGWLDEVLDLLHEAGIDVDLATPTASPPPWFCLANPDALYVDAQGVRTNQGSRNHYCPSSASYRAACRELAGVLGRRYGNHPAVVMWHIGNEYGPTCHCEACTVGFRQYLARRHGDIAALNRAWGTAFWSQGYRSFDEVLTPVTAPYHHNPSHVLDHRRFSSAVLLELYVEQRDVLRRHVGSTPITTNFMGFFAGVDAREWAGEVDVVADDHYIDPADREHGPARAALVHDLMRSLKQQPWLMMEQAMGAVNWRRHNTPKTDGQRRADVLRAIAHGADGVLSFQWRQSRHGAERFHSAMLPHAGAQTRFFASVCSIGDELTRLSPVLGTGVRARVALVFDWESWWAQLDPSLPSDRDPVATLLEWYLPLWRRGLAVDVVSLDDDLSGYAVVLAPVSHVVTDTGVAALRARLQAGAAVVLGPFTAVADREGAVRPAPFPYGLSDLLGAQVVQWWPLSDDGLHVTSSWGRIDLTGWVEQLDVTEATPIVQAPNAGVTGDELGPLVVRSTQVDLTYVGVDLPPTQLDALIGEVLRRHDVAADLGPLRGGASETGCEVFTRGRVTFVLNSDERPAHLELARPARDLLRNQTHVDHLMVPAGGAVALMEE